MGETTGYNLLTQAEYEKYAEESYLVMSDGSQLKILRTFAPKKTSNGYTLFVNPAFGSIILGWDEFLNEAMQDFDIVYYESREKGSSKLIKKPKMDMESYSNDIMETIEYLKLEPEKLIAFASSSSVPIVGYTVANKNIRPKLTVFVGPIMKIPIPTILRLMVLILPTFFVNIIRYLAFTWIKRKRSESPEQAAKYIRVGKEANPKKWKKGLRYFGTATYENIYPQIDTKVLVIDESEDKMHETEITRMIASLIPNAELIDLKTNKNTHSKPIVDVIREFVRK
ncbi:MAG: hypothetical protein KGD64_12840 [Candidatus Heimdallarchaeota archaeon]|nr:hypothetical protein [Candidatus Heimdallarchaeota archaeon]